MNHDIDIITATTTADFDAVRALCWDYRDFLLNLGGKEREVVEHFYPEDKYNAVMGALERLHNPPDGTTRLALLDGQPVGCGMIQRFDGSSAEMKRVFLRDSARGHRIGQALCEALIADCRALGYGRVLLDTGRPLVAAQELYRKLGFRSREAYQPVPDIALGTMVFFEKRLD